MLGRYADNLYWLARYLERAENFARRIEAGLHYALTRPDKSEEEWLSVLASTGGDSLFRQNYETISMLNVINFMLRDKTNANSVISLLEMARKNGRIVRTTLTQEVWQSLNQSWMTGQAALRRPVKLRDLPSILENTVQGSSVFRGALYGTMLHNDIFNFLRLGTFIERADNSARIIAYNHYRLLPTASVMVGESDNSQWEIILRSLGSWRSFNWLNRGQVDPTSVANFLIFDDRMPRSLSYCYKEIQANLHDLEIDYGREYDAGILARTIRKKLIDGAARTNFDTNLHEFITNFIASNNQLSLTIAKDFNLT